jgi:hypothetical protein
MFLFPAAFIEFAAWKNSLVVAPVIEKALPHFFVSWIRNYILGMLLYLTVGGLWCLTIYGLCRKSNFGDEEIPTGFAIMEQIKVSPFMWHFPHPPSSWHARVWKDLTNDPCHCLRICRELDSQNIISRALKQLCCPAF